MAGSSSDRATFQSLLDARAEAIVANDPVRIAKFTEPDWELIDTRGPIPLQRFLDVVRSGHLQHNAMTFDVLSTRRKGNVAIVVAHGTNEGRWNGEPFSADEWATDVFVLRDERWRCQLTSLTPRRVS